ncbi:FAD-dependent monooxygenase [Camelimonas abortus]|uniref:FAD-dependent monooxygenase n=1 Tax=Camelimonas abortus TaxID=1017184 RepID=A0ABV7LDW2_9HYPH
MPHPTPDIAAPDVAVIGAGAAGYAAALCLAQEGFRTVLLGTPAVAAPGRTVALFGGSVAFLRAIGAWEQVRAKAAPMDAMRIADVTDSLFAAPPLSFSAGELGLDSFGCNIPNDDLVGVLAQLADGRDSLAVRPETVTDVAFRAGGPELTLASGARLRPRLVVGADGARSLTRQRAGIGARTWSYPQAALTGVFRHTLGHRNASTELHTRRGPFTLVPMPGRRSSLVWVTTPDDARRLASLPPQELGRAVEAQAQSLLGEMEPEGACGVIPMRGLRAERFASHCVALVGEAGHVFPPIGAQGLNLGLRDVAALRDCLVAARDRGAGPDDPRALDAYDRSRRLDVAARTTVIDALNRALLSRNPAVDLLRGAGMLAMRGLKPLRRFAMREGLAPHLGLPELMRAWR